MIASGHKEKDRDEHAPCGVSGLFLRLSDHNLQPQNAGNCKTDVRMSIIIKLIVVAFLVFNC